MVLCAGGTSEGQTRELGRGRSGQSSGRPAKLGGSGGGGDPGGGAALARRSAERVPAWRRGRRGGAPSGGRNRPGPPCSEPGEGRFPNRREV